MLKKILLLTVVLFLCIAWNNDPYVNTSVCSAVGSQECACMVSDGFGGAIIAWEDHRKGNCDIFVQRVDSLGKTRWKKNGLAICTSAREQACVQMEKDGTGGAFFVWHDERNAGNYNIYAQRIDGKGKVMWQSGGVPICRAVQDQKFPMIVSDGNGGAIIGWLDARNGSDTDIYAQRIDADGVVQWAGGGVPVCTAANDQYQMKMTAENLGGAVLTWTDKRYSKKEIYAQRIKGDGIGQWTDQGANVSVSDSDAYNPQITSAGNGSAIITWMEFDNKYCYSSFEIYAQLMGRAGYPQWGSEGLFLSWEYGHEPSSLQVVPDGSLGAYVCWTDHDCPVQKWVEVEHVDASGVVSWHRGVGWSHYSYGSKITPDGAGGMIVSYLNDGYYGDANVYAQRFDSNGNQIWSQYGVTVCSKNGNQEGLQIVSDDAGGAIVSWHDGNIYAQNLCDTGGLGDCVFPVARIDRFRYGGIVPVTVNFDGSGSFDPDGNISKWIWDFGDGQEGTGKKTTHTYSQPGIYWINLRVRDNSGRWSAEEKSVVMTYTFDLIEAKIETTSQRIKAHGKGMLQVNGSLYETDTDPGRVERPIPVDLGMDYTSTSGTWQEDIIFAEGLYSRTMESGEPGTAEIKAVINGTVLSKTTVEFDWPMPPVNVKVEAKENRSLFRGEYYMYISWSQNPDENYTPTSYRIYRSTENGPLELVGEVDAGTLSYVDQGLPPGKQYSYAVTMVDSDGDESAASPLVTAL